MSCSPFFRKFPNSVLHQKENKHNKNKIQNVRSLTLKMGKCLWMRETSMSMIQEVLAFQHIQFQYTNSSQKTAQGPFKSGNSWGKIIFIIIYKYYLFLVFWILRIKEEANYARVIAFFPAPSPLHIPLESQIIMSLVGPRILFSGRVLA